MSYAKLTPKGEKSNLSIRFVAAIPLAPVRRRTGRAPCSHTVLRAIASSLHFEIVAVVNKLKSVFVLSQTAGIVVVHIDFSTLHNK